MILSRPDFEGFFILKRKTMSRVIICPFYIINNDNERREALEVLNERDLIDAGHALPYTIGEEEGFVFQSKNGIDGRIEDYYSEREGKTFKYELKTL